MSDDIGKLILRLMLGVLMLFHGYQKLTKGVSVVEPAVVNAGLPAWVGYGVYVGEVLAPLLVIAGFYARVGALVIVVNMIFAVVLVHPMQFWDVTRTGGWALELQAFYLLTGLAIALLGPGKFAVNRR